MKPSSKLRALSSLPFVAFRRSRVFAILAAIITFPAHAILDTNNNGLSDLWEKQHNNGNLFPNTFLATNDEDQDGWTNAKESIAGSDPFKANPPDGIVAVEITPSLVPGAFTLTWPTLIGKNYQLQVSTDLVNWTNLADPITTDQTSHAIGINVVQPDTNIPTKVFWRVVVTDLDSDNDGLTNAEEHALGTNPNHYDSDGDGMPDGWESSHDLDPLNAAGENGTEGDGDADGLSNFDEWLNNTLPNSADSDADGANDFVEVTAAGDPRNATDLGLPPPAHVLIDVPFGVSDPSGSFSEKWKMTIKGLGPEDFRAIHLATPGFGTVADQTFKLRKWNRYEVTIEHVATDPDYLAIFAAPDYDWEAHVDYMPLWESRDEDTSPPGSNLFFMACDHWLVDNRQAVFTTEKHGDDTNLLQGKKAYLIPVDVDDTMANTGVDDESIKANPADNGYQDQLWIMAPHGGEAITNEMSFPMPLISPTTLTMSCDETLPSPATLHAFGNGSPLVSWRGTGIETTNQLPEFIIGSAEESVSLPISIMPMKKRTVQIAVHSIASVVSGRANDPPNLMPTQAQVKAKLDAVFGKQINAWFEVRMVEPEAIAFDTADENTFAGFTFAPGIPVPSPGNRTLDFRNWNTPELSTATANKDGNDDIHVYVIGGATPFINYQISGNVVQSAESIYGKAELAPINACIVDGDRDRQTFDLDNNPTGYFIPENKRNVEAVLDTIAHEVGHIIVADGHPDEGSGPAHLVGTDRTKRLMCSGPNRQVGASLLVKKEWDAAEIWLKANVDRRYREENGIGANVPIGNY
jgi:hypothetical protein